MPQPEAENTMILFGKKTVCHVEVLTAEVWSPPLVDFGSSTLASISVGLELITQYMLLAIEPTHVIYAALEERSGIHHIDTLPRTEKTLIQIGEEKADGPTNTLKRSVKESHAIMVL